MARRLCLVFWTCLAFAFHATAFRHVMLRRQTWPPTHRPGQLRAGKSEPSQLLLTEQQQLLAVCAKIVDVEAEISQVCAEIRQVAKALEDDQASMDKMEKKQLRKKEEQLRTEEEQLRTKKEQLRTEKEQIRERELFRLRQEVMLPSALEHAHNEALVTPEKQHSASSFANPKKSVLGMGFLPTSFRLDPTADQRIAELLLPSVEEVSSETFLPVMGEQGTLAPLAESQTAGVRPVIDGFARRFPNLGSSGYNLREEGIAPKSGLVTPKSMPDFVWNVGGRVLGILEVKGGETSVLMAIRQAAVTGTSVAIDLLRRGLRPEQIVVPVAGTNGMTAQFGCIVMLEPSFPTFVPISSILDLSKREDNLMAAAYLSKASQCALALSERLEKCPAPSSNNARVSAAPKMVLDKRKYWVKNLYGDAFASGIGHFATSSSRSWRVHHYDVGPGLEHMARVLTRLYQNENTRGIPVYPLSFRSPNTPPENATVGDCYFAIYDDLSSQGYRIGTPNRLENEGQYRRYLVALRRAVELIHEAGVIHCDLYPSNIMWKQGQDNNITIRLIDWDCAHSLDEGEFGESISTALQNHKPTRTADFGTEHDLRYLRVLESDPRPDGQDSEAWHHLASTIKVEADDAFYHLFVLS